MKIWLLTTTSKIYLIENIFYHGAKRNGVVGGIKACISSSSSDYVNVGVMVDNKRTNTLTPLSLLLLNPIHQYLWFQFGDNVGSGRRETNLTWNCLKIQQCHLFEIVFVGDIRDRKYMFVLERKRNMMEEWWNMRAYTRVTKKRLMK